MKFFILYLPVTLAILALCILKNQYLCSRVKTKMKNEKQMVDNTGSFSDGNKLLKQ
jgi:hypothetical protein